MRQPTSPSLLLQVWRVSESRALEINLKTMPEGMEREGVAGVNRATNCRVGEGDGLLENSKTEFSHSTKLSKGGFCGFADSPTTLRNWEGV
jgi:hypothetical protein